MSTEMITIIVQTLAHLKICDRSTGINPFLICDVHDSRLDLPFLRYIDYTDHLCIVYIGVPYGTICGK